MKDNNFEIPDSLIKNIDEFFDDIIEFPDDDSVLISTKCSQLCSTGDVYGCK